MTTSEKGIRFNSITYPGGQLARFIRLLVKGIPMYPELKQSIQEGAPLESVYVETKPNAQNLPESIMDLFKCLENASEYVSVYIHGSYADGTTTDFSDIDDLIIIDDRMLSIRRYKKLIHLLNRVDMKFCRIDPLQHHGHWITSCYELESYDNSFVPLWLMQDAINIAGANHIGGKVNVAATARGLLQNIKTTSENIKLLGEKMLRGNISAYELKCLIGSFALMPALLFQLAGYRYDKPKSIKCASTLYSPVAMECISWAKDCRENWTIITKGRRFKLFSLIPYMFVNPHLWRSFSRRFSPKVTSNQLGKLSSIQITDLHLSFFVRESLVNAGE